MKEKRAILSTLNFNKFEMQALKQLEKINKAILNTFKFQMIYSSKVSEKQEKETSKAIKSYRNKFWTKALKKANGDTNKAYQYYITNLKESF